MTEPVLELDRVSVSYFTRAGEVPAVADVSLTLMPGESVGLVGESGCGKSTLALAIMQHFGPHGRLTAGRIRFRGHDLADFSPEDLRRIRGAQIGMIYQEAASALNPSLTIGEQLAEVPSSTMDFPGPTPASARTRCLLPCNCRTPRASWRRTRTSFPAVSSSAPSSPWR